MKMVYGELQPSPKQGHEEENFFPYEGGTNNP